MPRVNKKKFLIGGFMTAVFFIGLLSGLYIGSLANNQQSNDFSLIAKRAQIDNPNDPRLNFRPLRQDIESYLTSLDDNSGSNVSVYFEYLPSGVSININEDTESIAASLMKVPIVMTLYRTSNEGNIDIDKKIALKSEWLNDQYGDLYKKGEGYEVSLREAASMALADSDNTALLMIYDELSKVTNSAESPLGYLDVEFDTTDDDRIYITPQAYSSVLKCLYLACYNTKEDSQEILGYMTESSFDDRLARYMPEDLKIAHKIGTFSEQFQSDCGIFYVPERNYLLCVMVRGSDEESSRIIGEISNKAYWFIING